MTPFEIDILMHYYARAEDHPLMRRPPPIWEQTMGRFVEAGLLEPDPERRNGCSFRPLARLVAYADALQAVPLPIQKWVMPEPGDAT